MLPIMIAWVKVETRDSKKWFLEFLTRGIGFGSQFRDIAYTIMLLLMYISTFNVVFK